MINPDKHPGLVELGKHIVRKPWGRADANLDAGSPAGLDPVGEIWFDDPADPNPELLVKLLFTSERLSIQVHPDNEAARTRGFARGKDEAWYILDAEPGASIALGPKQAVTADKLRGAALDGSIEELVDWRPVRAGDFLFSPAGTVHAIGAGLRLIEIQQNLDLTYRLYDYGRPRELHLEDGIAVATLTPFVDAGPAVRHAGREVLISGRSFVVERWRAPFRGSVTSTADRPLLLIPLTEASHAADETLHPGSVWKLAGSTELRLASDAELLIAYAGSAVAPNLRA